MSNTDKIREFKVGERVVISNEGKIYYEQHSYEEDADSFEGSVYAIVVAEHVWLQEHIEVDWVNHKGMYTRRGWYMLKKYAELYEGS